MPSVTIPTPTRRSPAAFYQNPTLLAVGRTPAARRRAQPRVFLPVPSTPNKATAAYFPPPHGTENTAQRTRKRKAGGGSGEGDGGEGASGSGGGVVAGGGEEGDVYPPPPAGYELTRPWAVVEELLLAHVVLQRGEAPEDRDGWAEVAEKVRAMIASEAREPAFFTPPQCELRYREMVEETVHNTRRKVSGADVASPAEQVVQSLLHKRLRELKSSIRLKEKLIKSIHEQMADLESGELDDALELVIEANGTYAVSDLSSAGIYACKPLLVHRKLQPGLILSGSLDLTADAVASAQSTAAAAAAAAAAAVATSSHPSTPTSRSRVRAASQKRRASSASKSSKSKRKRGSDSGSPSSTPKASASKRRKNLAAQVSAAAATPVDATKLLALHKLVSNHACANPFKTPVTEADAPGYFAVVTTPMDLTTMRDMIKDGRIDSYASFRATFNLMIANAQAYNPKGNTIHEMASDFAAFVLPVLDKLDAGADISEATATSGRRSRRGG